MARLVSPTCSAAEYRERMAAEIGFCIGAQVLSLESRWFCQRWCRLTRPVNSGTHALAARIAALPRSLKTLSTVYSLFVQEALDVDVLVHGEPE